MTQDKGPLFTCPQFDVHCHSNGRHYIVAPDGAGVLALDASGNCLLTREYRPNLGRTVWRVPAGKVENGETMLQTAHRELREEAGYDARSMELFMAYDANSAFAKRKKAFFIARDIFESPLDTGDEEIAPEVHFVPPAEVLRLLNEGELTGDIAAALYRFLHTEKLI